jgi:hypothetical protein
MTIDQKSRRFLAEDFIVHKARCSNEYLDFLLQWAQQGDLNPLIEVFENCKRPLRLKPAMLKFLAEALRRVRKPEKNIARMATGERQYGIAVFVDGLKDHIGLMKAYQEAAKIFGYKDTKRVRDIYKHFAKLAIEELEQPLGMPLLRYEIDAQGLKQHFFPESGN